LGSSPPLAHHYTPCSKSLGDGTTEYTYDRTPVMSSYLVAFAVGNFGHIETRTKNNTLVRVFAVSGKEEQGRFALDVSFAALFHVQNYANFQCARRALDYYDEFFGIKYPMSKCDLIAVLDFAMGAMENWRLVTYREVCCHPDCQGG